MTVSRELGLDIIDGVLLPDAMLGALDARLDGVIAYNVPAYLLVAHCSAARISCPDL